MRALVFRPLKISNEVDISGLYEVYIEDESVNPVSCYSLFSIINRTVRLYWFGPLLPSGRGTPGILPSVSLLWGTV